MLIKSCSHTHGQVQPDLEITTVLTGGWSVFVTVGFQKSNVP